MTKSIHDFQDEYGRITSWPSDRRRAHQLAILDHLKNLLESGRSYSEEDLRSLLAEHTTLDDVSVLIRELVESSYVATDDSSYWRADGRPGRAG
ncbi:DUF2087 domain-containing protein [Deinococcus reticulitermitis]|nr:DUF2087 domain-containing protein [Deinococcus reticulitermitis]